MLAWVASKNPFLLLPMATHPTFYLGSCVVDTLDACLVDLQPNAPTNPPPHAFKCPLNPLDVPSPSNACGSSSSSMSEAKDEYGVPKARVEEVFVALR